ncbi:MAG: hypothetical protein COR54_02265 [Elusimicrobia bacterium CG22_combo_CG10-13_8_21_14_all_63_91]|nr:MAG: hypothetical protein COR54_02265 [Elusimicrobia bacterium CG22_combo_CG10-13_8_21_14_all_63_91]PJA14708.1 MAG: hypothetical protein COX66_11890 [Elusimicrobia bacterium CG_4_10_14_0_2_um_filter_63_34]
MKRNSLADEDDLMRTTRRVLFEFTAETCKRQYVVGKVVYVIGDCKWALPFDFDEFIAVGRSLLIHGEQEWRTRTFQRMGSSFAMLSLFYAQTLVEQPDLLASVRADFKGSFFHTLKEKAPQMLVFVYQIVVWPAEIDSCPVEPPAIIAIGLHATRIVGYVCTQRAGETHPMSFGKPVALSARLANAMGRHWYLKIFSPGKN